MALLALPCSVSAQGSRETSDPASGWAQFRGFNGQGIAVSRSLPSGLDLATNLIWRVPVAEGNASPVLLNDGSIVLAGHASQAPLVVCLRMQDGTASWTNPIATTNREAAIYPHSTGSSTPATDGTNIFAYFGSFGLVALDGQGKELWKHPFPATTNRNGTASSPIIHGGNVIQLVDCEKKLSFLAAFDLRSGEVRWKRERPHAGSGWSTPVVRRVKGINELLVFGNSRLDAYQAETGEPIWFIPGPGDSAVAVPVINGDYVILCASGLGSFEENGFVPRWNSAVKFDLNHDGRIQKSELPPDFGWITRVEYGLDSPGNFEPSRNDFAAMDSDHDGSVTEIEWEQFVDKWVRNKAKNGIAAYDTGKQTGPRARPAWESGKGISDVPSPLVLGDCLYTIKDGGVLTCSDPVTGRHHYQERLGAEGAYWASPVAIATTDAADIILVSSRGVVTFVRAGKAFHVKHRLDLEQEVRATPVIDSRSGRIYIRTVRELFAFGTP